jgi:TolB protein
VREPAWSPTGDLIAFEATVRGGATAIDVVAPDGTGLRQVARFADVASDPVWSPDGRRLLVVDSGEARQRLYVTAVDGSSQRRLVTEDAIGFSPVWSPDGQRIAYERIVGGGCRCQRNSDIIVLSVSSRLRRRVAHAASGPTWSPTGQLITFVHQRVRPVRGCWGMAVEAVRPDGRARRRLVRYTDGPGTLAWSPDGHQFVFASDGRCQVERTYKSLPRELFIANADGSGVKQLTKPPTNVVPGTLSWQPRSSRDRG